MKAAALTPAARRLLTEHPHWTLTELARGLYDLNGGVVPLQTLRGAAKFADHLARWYTGDPKKSKWNQTAGLLWTLVVYASRGDEQFAPLFPDVPYPSTPYGLGRVRYTPQHPRRRSHV